MCQQQPRPHIKYTPCSCNPFLGIESSEGVLTRTTTCNCHHNYTGRLFQINLWHNSGGILAQLTKVLRAQCLVSLLSAVSVYVCVLPHEYELWGASSLFTFILAARKHRQWILKLKAMKFSFDVEPSKTSRSCTVQRGSVAPYCIFSCKLKLDLSQL